MSLSGKICIVTGASRGIGKGIAVQVGEAGATVYITGRSNLDLKRTADEIASRGGKPIIVPLDHSKDHDIQELFTRVEKEHNGKLDLLVNNAFGGVKMTVEKFGENFWEVSSPVEMWDRINGVGLRDQYICTSYAARLMQANRSGLIVNISSGGGMKYILNVPYGVGKAASDRMAADCAHELKKFNVAMVSLWPGAVKTEEMSKSVIDNPEASDRLKTMYMNGHQTPEFVGKAVVKLASDPNIMQKTGKILITSRLAKEYDFKDVDGNISGDLFSVKYALLASGHDWLASIVPASLPIPNFLLHLGSYKF